MDSGCDYGFRGVHGESTHPPSPPEEKSLVTLEVSDRGKVAHFVKSLVHVPLLSACPSPAAITHQTLPGQIKVNTMQTRPTLAICLILQINSGKHLSLS